MICGGVTYREPRVRSCASQVTRARVCDRSCRPCARVDCMHMRVFVVRQEESIFAMKLLHDAVQSAEPREEPAGIHGYAKIEKLAQVLRSMYHLRPAEVGETSEYGEPRARPGIPGARRLPLTSTLQHQRRGRLGSGELHACSHKPTTTAEHAYRFSPAYVNPCSIH